MRIMENLIEKVIQLEKEAQIASKAADEEKLRKKSEIEEQAEAAKKELYEKMDKKELEEGLAKANQILQTKSKDEILREINKKS